MAYTFKSGKMISDQLDVMISNAVATEAIKDGSLLVLGDLVTDDTYVSDGKEYDLYKGAAPVNAEQELVIVDYAGIANGDIAGNNYKLGNKLFDLEIQAGEAMRVRRLGLHDKFWLGESNFNGQPVVGKYAIAEAGKMTHKPATEKPTNGYAVQILLCEDLTVGMRSNGKLYLCEVVHL